MKALYTDAAHKAKAAYAREYRRKNPERVKETARRYWERKAAEMGIPFHVVETEEALSKVAFSDSNCNIA